MRIEYKTLHALPAEQVTTVCGKPTEIGMVVFRTVIEEEILNQALYVLSATLESKFDEMSNLLLLTERQWSKADEFFQWETRKFKPMYLHMLK